MRQGPDENRARFAAFFIVMALVLIPSVIANLASAILDKAGLGGLWIGLDILIVVALLLPAYLAWRAVSRRAGYFLGARVKMTRAETQEAMPFLIMGYSPLEKAGVFDDALFELIKDELVALGAETVALPGMAYADAAAAGGRAPIGLNKWQQSLRAAWFHRKALQRILVLDPDKDQFEKFRSYLDAALKQDGKSVAIERISPAYFYKDGKSVAIERASPEERAEQPFTMADYRTGQRIERSYDDYVYVHEGMKRGLEMLTEAHPDGKVEGLTCVDATAGMKVFSIAAAVLTLNRNLVFSYVTTGPTGGELRFYDINLDVGVRGD